MSRHLMDIAITRDQLTAWGAVRLYNDRLVQRWMSKRTTLTVAEVLNTRTAGGRLFWTIMRPDVLPEALIHQCAVDLARHHLALVDKWGTYVDLRSRKTPAAKQAWLDGELSLGGLAYARRRAEDAQNLVAELNDKVAADTAQILMVVADTEPSWSFRQIYYRHRDVFDHLEADRAVIDLVRERINSW